MQSMSGDDNKATNTKDLYYIENRVTHETASAALRGKGQAEAAVVDV